MSIRAWTGDQKFLWLPPIIGLLLGALLLALPTILMTTVPDRWDRATVVKVCRDGTKVFQMEDGEYRVRTSIRSFHAKGPDVC
jgi:hypothetical protein